MPYVILGIVKPCLITLINFCRYYINHTAKSTTWEDPRLVSILPPPYNVAITQPTAYFEVSCHLNIFKFKFGNNILSSYLLVI